MSVGRGAVDLTGFLCKDMTIEARRRSEHTFLHVYTSLLEEHGVAGYPFDRCLTDYRLSMLKSFANIVVASTKGDLSPAQKQRTFAIVVPRFVIAILDHDASSLLLTA